MLTIDKTGNNGAIEIPVGDSVRIELPENPTTGYRWELAAPASALRIVEDSFTTTTASPGSGGMRHWTLAAESPATVALRIELKRSWEKQAAETFEVAITVKAR